MSSEFPTVRAEGGLLPPDVLGRIVNILSLIHI